MHREALTVLFGIGVLVLGADCVAKTERVAGDAGSARPEPDSRVSLEQKGRADITSVRLFSHTVNNNEVTITKYMGPDGAVSIPCTVSGLPVRAIGDSAFDKRAGLTGVTIPDGVVRIGKFAFAFCNGLTRIAIPASVSSIGASAFVDCHGLTSIMVNPANPAYCSSADGVLFNKERTRIIRYPAGKSGNYVIPKGVTNIEDGAFASCASLTNIILPVGMAKIGEWSFCNCSVLTGVTLPDGVTSIGTAAFYCCPALTDLVIPASVTSMNSNPFRGCSGLTSIRVNPANTVYSSSEDGVVFNREKTVLFCYPAGKAGNYEIPNSVIQIGESAFQGGSLTRVTVPCSVTAIGTRAFKWCHGLTGVYFNGNVPRNEGRTFEGTRTPIVYYRPEATGWGNTFGGRPTAVWKP